MDLPQNAIRELQEICQREFGDDLSDAESRALGASLLTLFSILLTPNHNGDSSDDCES